MAKKVPFERSKYDVEKKGVKEGSKEDRALDARQMAAAGYKRGGRVSNFRKGGRGR
jgi:hypothetical protein